MRYVLILAAVLVMALPSFGEELNGSVVYILPDSLVHHWGDTLNPYYDVQGFIPVYKQSDSTFVGWVNWQWNYDKFRSTMLDSNVFIQTPEILKPHITTRPTLLEAIADMGLFRKDG